MRFACLTALLLLAACREKVAPVPVRIAAASDLTPVLDELAKSFPQKVELTFGSSGLLARQLGEGAPFDLFAAANVSFADDAVKSGNCDGATKRSYARGRLVVWTRAGGAVPLEALADERYRHIAIANPEHAPYGQAAREALASAGLWENVEPRVVYADNVRAALQLAESGNAEVALVAASLVSGQDAGAFTLVDESKHKPLEQALVVCTRGSNAAGGRAFADLLVSEKGRAVLARYGFSLP